MSPVQQHLTKRLNECTLSNARYAGDANALRGDASGRIWCQCVQKSRQDFQVFEAAAFGKRDGLSKRIAVTLLDRSGPGFGTATD